MAGTSAAERERGIKILAIFGAIVLVVLAVIGVVYVRLSSAARNIQPISTLPGGDVRALWISPTNPNLWLAGQRQRVARSDDGGKTWRPTSLDGGVTAFTGVQDGSQSFILAAGNGLLARSDDAGFTWQRVATSPTGLDIQALTSIGGARPTLLASARGRGMLSSHDLGHTWALLAGGTPTNMLDLTELAGSVTTPGAGAGSPRQALLFAASPGAGVLVSTDGGIHWQAANGSVNLTLPASTTSLATDGTVLYAGTERGVYKSTDGGHGWFLANRGFTSPIAAVAASPGRGHPVAAATSGVWRVFRSLDGGATWPG
ncbi:MAG: WD40/YVTN/BNR-like repeat-containing protein [Chloroflexota bacterium]